MQIETFHKKDRYRAARRFAAAALLIVLGSICVYHIGSRKERV